MTIRKIYFIVCLFHGLLIPLNVFSAIYHLDVNHPFANDANQGTRNAPWRTLQGAADRALAGDTVYVHSGVYAEVVFHLSGQAASPVRFFGVSKDSVIIQGGMEFSKGAAYLELANFTIQNFTVWGVFLRGNNHHIHLKNLTITGGEAGIHLTYGYQAQDPLEGPVSDILVENCLIRNCKYTAIDGTPGPCDRLIFRHLEISGAGAGLGDSWGADGIAIERGRDILVEDCYIHDNLGDGIDLNSRDFDGRVQGIVVRRNRVIKNHRTGIKLWAGGRIENNVLWGQGNSPIFIGAFPGDYALIHNTIAYNMWDPNYSVRNYAFVAAYPNDDTVVSASIDLRMVNNIFAFNSSEEMGGSTGIYLGRGVNLIQESHNLYWSREDGEIQAEFLQGETWFSRNQISDGSWNMAIGLVTGDITANPLFASSWPAADLQLLLNSPAIDSGHPSDSILVDILGHARPSGKGFDVGAYEHVSNTGIKHDTFGGSISLNTIVLQNIPNPFNARTTFGYRLLEAGSVDLSIFNLLGQKVRTWDEAEKPAGKYTVIWDAKDDSGSPVGSGIYIFRLVVNDQVWFKKMTLLE